MSKFQHKLANSTADLLQEYAENIFELSSFGSDEEFVLSLSHGIPITIQDKIDNLIEVKVNIDKDHIYYFNDIPVGNLNNAIKYYGVICAPLFKKVIKNECDADNIEKFLEKTSKEELSLAENLPSYQFNHELNDDKLSDNDFESYSFGNPTLPEVKEEQEIMLFYPADEDFSSIPIVIPTTI